MAGTILGHPGARARISGSGSLPSSRSCHSTTVSNEIAARIEVEIADLEVADIATADSIP
jgi:hypothetical protein